jgi:hypothetical protein
MAWEVHSSRTSGAPVMPELAEEAAAGVNFPGFGSGTPESTVGVRRGRLRLGRSHRPHPVPQRLRAGNAAPHSVRGSGVDLFR